MTAGKTEGDFTPRARGIAPKNRIFLSDGPLAVNSWTFFQRFAIHGREEITWWSDGKKGECKTAQEFHEFSPMISSYRLKG
jgi:hypothetical protein